MNLLASSLVALKEIPLGNVTPPTTAFSKDSNTKAGALSNMELFFSNLIGFFTILGALFFIVYFVLGAISWITSGGDKGKIEKARDQMVQGVLGMVVIVAAYGIIGIVGSIIGLDILNPAKMVEEILKPVVGP